MILWSPWNIIEPNANVSFSETMGKIKSWQEWDGKIIGAGRMEITDISDNIIKFDLNFIKPFKSQAKTAFVLEEIDGKTKVSWIMDNSLPWFMFFIKKMMFAMISMDYEKGLRMLKEYVETGEVLSKISLNDKATLKEMEYIGIENQACMSSIGDKMEANFSELIDFAKKNNLINEKTEYFSIYNKFDIIKDDICYTSAISIDSNINVQIPNRFIKSKIKKSKAISVTHQGKYEHLGNAWGLAMMYPRAKKIKIQKKPVGYEFYYNNPHDTKDKDLLTNVVVGVK
jgi:effector-binding domain-containing protein